MTLYGIDVSNHQGAFNFGAAKAEGFSFATHKITEGNSYKDPYWPRALDEMRKHFPGRHAGYHFWRRGDANRQADLLLAHIGDPSVPIQLDFEDTDAAKNVTLDEMFAIIRAIQDRGMRVFSNYLPRWYWDAWMHTPNLAGTPPLWNSDYGPNREGYASAIYPGDSDGGWRPFGTEPVALYQFSERGYVAGQFRIDVNAFRGTETQLDVLFGGAQAEEFDDMTVAGEVKNQQTGSPNAGEYPGWPAWRWGLPNDQQPSYTQTDYLRGIDRELNSEFDVKDAPTGDKGTIVGQVLALRAEVRELKALIETLIQKAG